MRQQWVSTPPRPAASQLLDRRRYWLRSAPASRGKTRVRPSGTGAIRADDPEALLPYAAPKRRLEIRKHYSWRRNWRSHWDTYDWLRRRNRFLDGHDAEVDV